MLDLAVSPSIIIPADHEFYADMTDYFADVRKGHIVRHGFPGKGGTFYSQWLKEHKIYKELVTKPELRLINAFVDTLAEICGETVNFYEGGVGSLTAFKIKTLPLLKRIAARRGHPINYTVVDVTRGPYETVKNYILDEQLPLIPNYIQANMFATLPKLPPQSAFWVPGITFTNISVDAIQKTTENVYADTFSYFHGVLPKGGILAYTSVNNKGIAPNGEEVEVLYNHPLNNKYQLWIYERLGIELPVIGDYSHEAFGSTLRFQWHHNNHVLTRHTHPSRRMQFDIGEFRFDLYPDFDGYHGNNFRPPDELTKATAIRSGFAEARIYNLPGSNLNLPILING